MAQLIGALSHTPGGCPFDPWPESLQGGADKTHFPGIHRGICAGVRRVRGK